MTEVMTEVRRRCFAAMSDAESQISLILLPPLGPRRTRGLARRGSSSSSIAFAEAGVKLRARFRPLSALAPETAAVDSGKSTMLIMFAPNSELLLEMPAEKAGPVLGELTRVLDVETPDPMIPSENFLASARSPTGEGDIDDN